jgi:phage shock protein A
MPEEIFDLLEDLFDGAKKRRKKQKKEKQRQFQEQERRPAKPREAVAPVTPAPNPQADLEATYQLQRKALEALRRNTDDVTTARMKLEERARFHEQQLVDFDERARQHLIDGREDLARIVLERKRMAVAQVSEFEREIETLKREEAELMRMEAQLEAELESFWLRSEVLKSQQRSAEARSRFSGDFSQVGSALDEAEAHVAELNSRSRLLDGMLSSGGGATDAHARFERDLELTGVDADLEALRRQMRQDRSTDR